MGRLRRSWMSPLLLWSMSAALLAVWASISYSQTDGQAIILSWATRSSNILSSRFAPETISPPNSQADIVQSNRSQQFSLQSLTSDCAADWYWCTDHETRTMEEWEYGQGQAVFNYATLPGSGAATISNEQAHSGDYSLRLAITGATNGQKQAVRVFRRWLPGEAADAVIPLPDEAYYSAWYYFPELVTPALWWNLFQFKSKAPDNPSADSEPMFTVQAIDHAPGEISLYIANKVGGSESIISYFQRHPRAIPIGEWVHFEAYLKKSDTFDGQLLFWQNGELIFERTNIQTIDKQENRLQWSVNNYSDDLTPADAVIYVDDAVVSATQVSRDFPALSVPPACSVYHATSVPKELPIGNTWNRSYLTIEGKDGEDRDDFSIEDLNVSLDIDHTKVADLTVLLEHEDSGVSAVLIDRPGSLDGGCLNRDVVTTLTDEANMSAEIYCASTAPTLGGELKPITPLSVFDGLPSSGRWILTIEDADPAANPGLLNGWSLESCPVEERTTPIVTEQPVAEELSCTTYWSHNEPTGLSFGNAWLRNSLVIESGAKIADIRAMVAVSRTAIGELTVSLSHIESNINVQLLDRPGRPEVEGGCRFANLSATFDDDAQQPGEDACAEMDGAITGSVRPQSPLRAFYGIESDGAWMLTIEAAHPSTDVGTLDAWGVEICHVTTEDAPSQNAPNIDERISEHSQLFVPFLSQ